MMKQGLLGKRMDRMPNYAFKIMAAIFWVRDRLVSVGSLLDNFGIQPGQTVVDYGCGPGSYITKVSELVGKSGRVMAVDVQELAIESINRRIRKEHLKNVTGHVAVNGKCPLPDQTADVIYALDMFHMVGDPIAFLHELQRILKPGGRLFIDNGHQSRQEARDKIKASGIWKIVEENQRYMICQ